MKFKDRIKELRRVRAGDLIPSEKNWRSHPQAQKDAMLGVLDQVGYADALLVRETPDGLKLIDGHLRAEVTPDQDVPVLVLDVTEEEADIILATLDPLAAMAEADTEKLAELMEGIEVDDEAVQALLEELAAEAGIIEDAPAIVEDEAPIDRAMELQEQWGTAEGQLWVIEGRNTHKLLIGDSTKVADVERVMGGEKTSLVHADPPYGMGKEKDGVINDNLYGEKLDGFQMDWWLCARPHMEDNASAYIWGNAEDLWRLWYSGGLKDSERLTLRNEIAWHKGDNGFGVGTEAQRSYFPTERCLFFMLGEQGFNNNADNYWEGWEPIRLALEADMKACGWTVADLNRITGTQMSGHWVTRSQWCLITEEHYKNLQEAARDHDAFKRDHDKLKQEFYATRSYFDNTHDNMTDVWQFKRVTGEERHGHATPKPVEMIARIIKSSSEAGATVYEPFLGSGTTMAAADQLNRKCAGIEISPKYCAVILERMTALGCKPRLESE